MIVTKNTKGIVLLLCFIVVSIGIGCSVKTKRDSSEEPPATEVAGSSNSNSENSKNIEKTAVAESESASDSSIASAAVSAVKKGSSFTPQELSKFCSQKIGQFPGQYDKELLESACKDVQILDSCVSRNGQPIFHYDRPSIRKGSERILTFAVTHGDELPSGSVARGWMNRLSRINPRNEWRIVPLLNPDGFDQKTRYNAGGVDINRNYPSEDWNEKALKWWEQKKKSDKRRYPGPTAGSEPETLCSIDHIEDFQPDLIISVHTPLGVLDFDGPRLNFPSFSNLPWISLGTYPGSLGRFMWHDRKVPVLTIELKSNIRHALDKFDQLQDISGQVALTISKQEKNKKKQ